MIRRYTEADIQVMINHIQGHHLKSQFKDLHFDRNKMLDLLTGNIKNSLFFCNIVDLDGVVSGGFCATLARFIFNHDVFAEDHFFYMDEKHRGATEAVALLESYVEWAKNRRAKRVRLMNVSGIKPELFAKFAERHGFKLIGSVHMMEI